MYFNNALFGDFIIVPSTWHNDKGTGVKGYFKTSSMSIFFSRDKHSKLPKRSLIKHAAIIFPSFDVIFFAPDSVAKVFTFCFVILCSKRFSRSMHSSINLLHSLSPMLSIFKTKSAVSADAAFPVAIL